MQISGSSASYRSSETGARIPLHHRQHGGGEDRGEGRGEAAPRQVGHPAGPFAGQTEQRPQQGRNVEHDPSRRRPRLRLQGIGHHRRRYRIYPRQERKQSNCIIHNCHFLISIASVLFTELLSFFFLLAHFCIADATDSG